MLFQMSAGLLSVVLPFFNDVISKVTVLNLLSELNVTVSLFTFCPDSGITV